VLHLITIPISHYCEKARWVLDRAGIPYREKRHIQGVHQIAARRAGGGNTVPVLVTPDGVLSESADILAWVDERTPPDRRLFPADAEARSEVEALCRRFDEKLGPHGRRLMYIHVLKDKELVLGFNNAGVPGWEDKAIRIGWPVALRFAKHRLDITPGIERQDEATVWREFDFAADVLADGRPYLVGDRFSAADLTFAALAGPMVVPPEYTVALPQPGAAMPQEPLRIVERAREHPGGQHALRMFREHRRELAGVAG
jgi:glutathione S-transferase